MSDRIIPRHDTLARWAEVNPILLEGEWGIVTDSPSLYKVGDGFTAWNDLPFRGYDGNIVQTTGDSTKSVMSQAAASQAFAPKSTTYTKTEVGNLVAEAVAPKADKSDVDSLAEATNQALKRKTDTDGTYEQMTVGFAQDIVGDGSATVEEFSFRPTAGEDRNVANTIYYEGERNGVARIEKIKGNSVVWNQLFNYSDRVNTDRGVTSTVDNNSKTISFSGVATESSATIRTINTPKTHKFILFAQCLENPNGISFAVSPFNVGRVVLCNLTAQINSNYVFFTQAADRTNTTIGIRDFGGVGTDVTEIVIRIQSTDLTLMFGAGNEPTTIEEFYERLQKVVDINAYNEGEIIDGNYGAIKTVGFNAFNGTYAKVCGGCPYYLGGNYTSLGFATEEGGTTEAITLPTSAESVGTTPSDRLYTPTQNGYIYAEGENININLSWDTEYGYLNGTNQPYKPFECDLSWINHYFPNGMRSAGSVRDEIRFNSTKQKWEAVQNVGVRAYASGDESNSAVITDGVNTNYALATPDVSDIEETPSMDFDVSDYGTEELIVAARVQSAALVADISYAPNALSTIKQVPDILKRLKALESAVAQQTTNVEPSNIEE